MAQRNEILPVVNENGDVISSASRKECHNGSMLLHPVVHLHVMNHTGHLLLQKRSMDKLIQPGKWDTSVGGHIDYGESVAQSLAREAAEEIGLRSFFPKLICCYVMTSNVERELIYSHITRVDDSFCPESIDGETDELKFWSFVDITKKIGSGIFTPNFEHEFQLLMQYLTCTDGND